MTRLVVLHGTPGSGKTTHASKFKELYPSQIEHISVGNRLRSIKTGQAESVFKKDIEKQASILAQSKPLNHEIVNGVIFEFVEQCPSVACVLIDGYPRFLDQLPLFFDSISQGDDTYLGIINLFITEKTCINRLTGRGNRPGEKSVDSDFARWRFNEYQIHTLPTISELGVNSNLININAEPPIHIVWSAFHAYAQQLTQIENIQEDLV